MKTKLATRQAKKAILYLEPEDREKRYLYNFSTEYPNSVLFARVQKGTKYFFTNDVCNVILQDVYELEFRVYNFFCNVLSIIESCIENKQTFPVEKIKNKMVDFYPLVKNPFCKKCLVSFFKNLNKIAQDIKNFIYFSNSRTFSCLDFHDQNAGFTSTGQFIIFDPVCL